MSYEHIIRAKNDNPDLEFTIIDHKHLIVSPKGLPGVYVSLYRPESVCAQNDGTTGVERIWAHHKGLACRVARMFGLVFPTWAATFNGAYTVQCELEPFQLELGSSAGFRAMHYNDRLKQAIGWLGPPTFEWEEPGLYTPQRFAQWGEGTLLHVRLQSGGRDFRTGEDLPTALCQLGVVADVRTVEVKWRLDYYFTELGLFDEKVSSKQA